MAANLGYRKCLENGKFNSQKREMSKEKKRKKEKQTRTVCLASHRFI